MWQVILESTRSKIVHTKKYPTASTAVYAGLGVLRANKAECSFMYHTGEFPLHGLNLEVTRVSGYFS